MKRKGIKRQEWIFLAVSLAVTTAILALAFLDTAPLQPVEADASSQVFEDLMDAARVDLNTADLDALCTLPGIGEKKAQAILDDRAANGPYERVEDVTRVSGITQNTIRKWEQLAYVS